MRATSLTVTWDDEGVYLRATNESPCVKDRSFRWAEVNRVWFWAGDSAELTDLLRFDFADGRDPITFSTEENEDGAALFDELARRGFFPADLFEHAARSAKGELFYWPRLDAKGSSLREIS